MEQTFEAPKTPQINLFLQRNLTIRSLIHIEFKPVLSQANSRLPTIYHSCE